MVQGETKPDIITPEEFGLVNGTAIRHAARNMEWDDDVEAVLDKLWRGSGSEYVKRALKLYGLVEKNIAIYGTDIDILRKNLLTGKYISEHEKIWDHEKLERIIIRQKVLKELLGLLD